MLAVVEVAGVGYELRVPLSTLEALKGLQEVLLYTRLWVREDDLRLYGFATRAERELFQLMLSVSGVGPSIALAALSALPVEALASALGDGDTGRIRAVKGVGQRLAERLVVELRDRVKTLEHVAGDGGREIRPLTGAGDATSSRIAQDAVTALIELGFKRKAAEEKVVATLRRLDDEAADLAKISVEQLIREALR